MTARSRSNGEREAVIRACNQVEQWLWEKSQQQDAVPRNFKPVLWAHEIRKKARALDAACRSILEAMMGSQQTQPEVDDYLFDGDNELIGDSCDDDDDQDETLIDSDIEEEASLYEATLRAAAVATAAPLPGGKQRNPIVVPPLPKPMDDTTGEFFDKTKVAAQLREGTNFAPIKNATLMIKKMMLPFDPDGEEELQTKRVGDLDEYMMDSESESAEEEPAEESDGDWELGPLSVPIPPPLKLSPAPPPLHFNSSTITASMQRARHEELNSSLVTKKDIIITKRVEFFTCNSREGFMAVFDPGGSPRGKVSSFTGLLTRALIEEELVQPWHTLHPVVVASLEQVYKGRSTGVRYSVHVANPELLHAWQAQILD